MPRTGRTKRIALGVLLAALVVLAGCAGGGGLTGGGGGDGGGDSGAVQPASGNAGATNGQGSFYVGDRRIVIREASMRLEVRTFDPAFRNARRIAREHGGFVAGWDHDVERGWHSGELEIRVPAENFTAVRDDLTGLGDVEREDVRAKDFTDEYRNTGDRLGDLRRERRELQRLLARTNDTAEARRIHDDLVAVREEIRRLEQRRAGIERREALSTIRLSLHEPPSERPPRNYEAAFGFDDAFLDAFHGGLAVVKYAIVFFGYAIPVGFAAVLVGGFGVACLRLWLWLRSVVEAVLPETVETERSPTIGDDADDADGEGDREDG